MTGTNILKSSWPTVQLGTLLTDIQPGFASGMHNSTGEGIPHLRPMNVSSEGFIDRSVLKYIDPALANRSERQLKSGDVLFNNTNSPELVGKTALFVENDMPAFSNHMTRLRTDIRKLDPGYLAMRLHFAWMCGYFAEHCNNHVSQASIGRRVLEDFMIELPPLDVQITIRQILDKIRDKQIAASTHLSVVRRIIERFRQAVLAAACSGHLTADWREINPAAQSVEYALTKVKSKRVVSEAFDDLPLPDVPDSYVISTVGRASVTLEYGTSKRADAPNDELPILRMGNIQNGDLELDDLKHTYMDSEIERLILQDGDLLFNRTNSPELVGKSAVFHEGRPMTFASYLIRVRFAPDVADPDFVNYWINSAWGKAWAHHVKTDGVSQSNINGSKLAAMPLPLPSIEEQREIVRRGSQMLQLAETLLKRIDVVTHAVERSTQAALAKAFRGELTVAASDEQGAELAMQGFGK